MRAAHNKECEDTGDGNRATERTIGRDSPAGWTTDTWNRACWHNRTQATKRQHSHFVGHLPPVLRRASRVLRQVWDKTSLVTLGALITHLSVFITNDTGLAHIAYALATPTVTIFGGGSSKCVSDMGQSGIVGDEYG